MELHATSVTSFTSIFQTCIPKWAFAFSSLTMLLSCLPMLLSFWITLSAECGAHTHTHTWLPPFFKRHNLINKYFAGGLMVLKSLRENRKRRCFIKADNLGIRKRDLWKKGALIPYPTTTTSTQPPPPPPLPLLIPTLTPTTTTTTTRGLYGTQASHGKPPVPFEMLSWTRVNFIFRGKEYHRIS